LLPVALARKREGKRKEKNRRLSPVPGGLKNGTTPPNHQRESASRINLTNSLDNSLKRGEKGEKRGGGESGFKIPIHRGS